MIFAPIAQLDRVTGYEPVGRGFESLLACHCIRKNPPRFTRGIFCKWEKASSVA